MNKSTLADFGLLLLRIGLAVVITWYGAWHLFGSFDGPGVAKTLSGFHEKHGFPTWLGWLAIISEFFGGIAVGLGLLTRLAAFGITCTMAVAAFTNFQSGGFDQKTHLPFALMWMALALLFMGAGPYSVEGYLAGRRPGRKGKAA